MRKILLTMAAASAAMVGLAGCNATVINQDDLAACNEYGAAAIDKTTLTVRVDSPDLIADMASCLADNTTAPEGSYDLLTDPANEDALTGAGLQISIADWTVVTGSPSPDWEINIG
ncbi:hypothetical protein [Demequina lignilytica]|uniref:Uncharacterized protein n=1 Tax=Demequina lignilytica TaxID=3051663 RepID=A0AB35MI63_9MICO|nr:hypothetical protein [Demequina sp. SYSU T0a273]MDN4483507.1 hypothetical protein [Demequina sp. SYSU T0a273]